MLNRWGYSLQESIQANGNSRWFTLTNNLGHVVKSNIKAMDAVLLVFARATGANLVELIQEFDTGVVGTRKLPSSTRTKTTQPVKERIFDIESSPVVEQLGPRDANLSYGLHQPVDKPFREWGKRCRDGRPSCPNCNEFALVKAGGYKSKAGQFGYFRCKACLTKHKYNVDVYKTATDMDRALQTAGVNSVAKAEQFDALAETMKKVFVVYNPRPTKEKPSRFARALGAVTS